MESPWDFSRRDPRRATQIAANTVHGSDFHSDPMRTRRFTSGNLGDIYNLQRSVSECLIRTHISRPVEFEDYTTSKSIIKGAYDPEIELIRQQNKMRKKKFYRRVLIILMSIAGIAGIIGFFFFDINMHPCEQHLTSSPESFVYVMAIDFIIAAMFVRQLYNFFVHDVVIPGTIAWALFLLMQMVNTSLYYYRSIIPVSDSKCGGSLYVAAALDLASMMGKVGALVAFWAKNEFSDPGMRKFTIGVALVICFLPVIVFLTGSGSTFVSDMNRLNIDLVIFAWGALIGLSFALYVCLFFLRESLKAKNPTRQLRLLLYFLGILLGAIGQIGLVSVGLFLSTISSIFFAMIYTGVYIVFLGTEVTMKRSPYKIPILFILLIITSIAFTAFPFDVAVEPSHVVVV